MSNMQGKFKYPKQLIFRKFLNGSDFTAIVPKTTGNPRLLDEALN